MFTNSSLEHTFLRADPEELSKGTYPGPEGRNFGNLLVSSFSNLASLHTLLCD